MDGSVVIRIRLGIGKRNQTGRDRVLKTRKGGDSTQRGLV